MLSWKWFGNEYGLCFGWFIIGNKKKRYIVLSNKGWDVGKSYFEDWCINHKLCSIGLELCERKR